MKARPQPIKYTGQLNWDGFKLFSAATDAGNI